MPRVFKTSKGKPQVAIDRVVVLPWCNAKYPYTDDCWAAANGRVLSHLACKGCDMLRPHYRSERQADRIETDFIDDYGYEQD